MRMSRFGHALLGIGVAGFAVLGFVYGNFGPVVAPFPKAWTYGLAAILLVASAGLFPVRSGPASAIIIGICASAWAVANASPILHKPMVVGSWYGSSEAVTTLVGAWIFYAQLRRRDHAIALIGSRALRLAQALFGAACLVYGIAHFAYAAYTEPFVPTWLPSPMAFVYATGACHVAAGIGLLLGVLPRLAATLEAIMITLFGVMVWLPSYFTHPTPKWAGSPQNQWSETFMNFLLAGTAWIVAESLRGRPWGFARLGNGRLRVRET